MGKGWNRALSIALWVIAASALSAASSPERAADAGPRPAAWLESPQFDPPALQAIGDVRSVPNGRVTAIAEDRDGLIWLGSTYGIYRFDGHRFTPEDDAKGLGLKAFVRALHAGRDGRLWVSVQGAGVFYRNPRDGEYARVGQGDDEAGNPDLELDDVWAFAEEPEGALWIADAARGLFRLQAHGGARGHQQHFEGRSLRAVHFDPQHGVWAGGRIGLYHRAAGAADFVRIPGLEGHFVYAIHAAADGRLWIGTQDSGSAIHDPQTGETHWLDAPEPGAHWMPLWVDSFAERVPGEMWVATFGSGIEVRDSASGRLLRRLRHVPGDSASLATDRVTALLRDRAGQLWVPTWGGGLQRLPAGIDAIQTLRAQPRAPDALHSTTMISSLPMPGDELWVGAAGEGIDVLDLREYRVVRRYRAGGPDADLPDGVVSAMARDAQGQVWVGTMHGGLVRRPEGGAAFLPIEGIGRGQRVRRLLAAADGGVWVGLEAGLRRVDAAGRVLPAPVMADGGSFDAPIWALAVSDDALWVGTDSGLWVAASDPARLLPVAFNGESAGILDLALGADGRLWVLAQNALYRQRQAGAGTDFERLLTTTDVASGLGQQLIEAADGAMWTGRIRIDPRDGRARVLGAADGIDLSQQVWAAGSRLADGRLVFGGAGGLVLIDPARFMPWRFQPQVVLTSVELNGRTHPTVADALTIPAGAHRLVVGFAALDYSDPSMLRYRYQLEGIDEDWVETSAEQRVAAYGNLWPGVYRLRIQGSNRVGDWSPHERVLTLRVEAAFWQTPWAFLLAGLLMAGLLVLVVSWRGRIATQRSRELRTLVAQRTRELEQARDVAESALLELRGAQGQLVEAEKMASLGQLVAGVAHELNTPLGNALVVSSTLQEQAKTLVQAMADGQLKRGELESFLRLLDEGSDLVVRSIGRAHDLVSSFKQVAVDRSSSQRRAFDLRGVVGEALDMLAPSLRHRPCRIESRVPEGITMQSYPGAIHQIVTNMVNNAVLHAFADSGEGVLVIEARVRDAAQGREVVIEFIDDGVGMDESTRHRVFEPFFTTRMGRGGTGLGLSVVYNLVSQLLGGSIRVESEPGAGTRFELLLPLIAPAEADD